MTLLAPLRRVPVRRRDRPSLVGELLVVLILVKVYDLVRSFAATRQSEAETHGRDVLTLEGHLHLDLERPVNHWLTSSSLLTDAAAGWYQFAHLTITLVALACCYRWRSDIYRRARNSLVLMNVVGLAVFWLYPVAPPRLLPGLGFIDADALAGLGQGPAGPISPNLYGAMPSLHLAWATWTVIVLQCLLHERPRLKRLAPAHAVITAFVVVATANHFVLDVVAGIAVCLVTSLTTGLIGSVRDTAELPGGVIELAVPRVEPAG
jgi:hypothetical protein